MFNGRIQMTFLVTDVARSVEFYTEVLGFGFSGFWDGKNREIVDCWTGEDPPEYAEVFAGENAVGLRKAGRVVTAGTAECSLDVRDVLRIHDAALRMGVDIPEPEDQPWNARTLSLRDPDGYLWHFIERKEMKGEPAMAVLKKGDRAPDFELEDQQGKKVRLADFRGRKVLLYFYPRAGTSGCTTQALSVRDARKELEARGVSAIGVSPDSPGALRKFDEKNRLGFPLLSDRDHAVSGAYGTWAEKTRCGKTSVGMVRSSFLIDEGGVLAGVWYKVSPKDTVPLALKAVES